MKIGGQFSCHEPPVQGTIHGTTASWMKEPQSDVISVAEVRQLKATPSVNRDIGEAARQKSMPRRAVFRLRTYGFHLRACRGESTPVTAGSCGEQFDYDDEFSCGSRAVVVSYSGRVITFGTLLLAIEGTAGTSSIFGDLANETPEPSLRILGQ